MCVRSTRGAPVRLLLTLHPRRYAPACYCSDEILFSFRRAMGLDACDLLIVCDGYRATDSAGRPQPNSKYRAGIVTPEALRAASIRPLPQARASASAKTEIIERLDRLYDVAKTLGEGADGARGAVAGNAAPAGQAAAGQTEGIFAPQEGDEGFLQELYRSSGEEEA